VDVQLIAEGLAGHRRALDVPARSAGAPRAVPGRLGGLGTLPQREVTRVAFARLQLLAGSDQLAVQIAPAELAVLGKRADLEVDVAIDGVGVAGLNQAIDETDDLVHAGRDARELVGAQDAQAVHDAEVRVDVLARRRLGIAPVALGALDDLVVDIGEVLDVLEPEAAVLEIAADDVHGHEHAAVPDVGMELGRHAAHVYAQHAVRTQWRQVLGCAAQRRVNANSHASF
jgi:hypothetical protein